MSLPNSSAFDSVPLEAPDVIFGLLNRFKSDPNKEKVDLIVGAYRTNEGKAWVLPSVRKAEELLLEDHVDHEYLPLDGLPSFTRPASQLILGKDSLPLLEGRVASIQALSGSGALRLAGEFLRKFYPFSDTVYLPSPTWPNHQNIFGDAGLKLAQYRYFDQNNISLDLDGLLFDLNNAPKGSIILLHSCAHNPTGVDPTKEEWEKIADICKKREFLAFFDSAYQGFATGDLEGDAFSVRLFVEKGVDVLVAQSFSKNLGLYGERIGNLLVVCKSSEIAEKVLSQLKRISRGMISNCPSYGARICSKIFNNPELYKQWEEDVRVMANRIIQMREGLFQELTLLNTPGSWEHVKTQIGMFAYTGLSPAQSEELMSHHHVYLTKSGRISLAGLNTANLKAVARAIHQVVVAKS